MNIIKVIKTKGPRLFAEDNDSFEAKKVLDLILIDARERSKDIKKYGEYVWGSACPLLVSVYKDNDYYEPYGVEILNEKTKKIDFDVIEYLKNKPYQSAKIAISDGKESPEKYDLMKNEKATILRFSNHKSSNVLYQTNKNIFFGFDDDGVLSELIYLGKAMTERLLGEKIVDVVEVYPNRRIKREMGSLSKLTSA